MGRRLPTTKLGPLFHGTTEAAAERILAEGFRGQDDSRSKGAFWLTRHADLAHKYALARAEREGGTPVVLHIPGIEGVSAHAVGFMDFKMAREAGAEFSDMGVEVAVHHPSIIRGVISRHQFEAS